MYVDGRKAPSNTFEYCNRHTDDKNIVSCENADSASNYTITKADWLNSIRPYIIAEASWFSGGCEEHSSATIYSGNESHNATKEEFNVFLSDYNKTCEGCVLQVYLDIYV